MSVDKLLSLDTDGGRAVGHRTYWFSQAFYRQRQISLCIISGYKGHPALATTEYSKPHTIRLQV